MNKYLLLLVVVFLASVFGQSIPLGDLDGWRQIFTEDFSRDISRGEFPGEDYGNKWDCYSGFNSTDKRGVYNANIINVTGGILNMYIHTNKTSGESYTAAPVPLINGTWGGQVYGRYSIRFRSDSLPGYKTAWLLWPDTDNWTEGEIDFPEGDLNGTISGYSHCTTGTPSDNCFYVNTDVTYTNWHIATIEWAPTYLSFILDGTVLKTTNSSDAIPTTAFHWVLQTETWYTIPDPNVAGNVQIDWAVIYAYDTNAVAPTEAPTTTTTSSSTSTSTSTTGSSESSQDDGTSSASRLVAACTLLVGLLFI